MNRTGLQKIVATAAVALALTGVAMMGCSSTTTVTGEGGINCGTGSTQCGDTCTVVARDTQNCGACGKACAMGEVCSQGICASSCGGGTAKCGNECVDNKSDPRNCGMCGKACAANEVCMAGACASSCAMPTTKCGMACVNTQTDRTNCGMCGTLCKDGEICSGGMCSISCQQGLTKCNASMIDGGVPEGGADGGPQFTGDFCANLMADNGNCGMCGKACSASETCVSGTCSSLSVTNIAPLGTVTISSGGSSQPYLPLEANNKIKEVNDASRWAWVTAGSTPAGGWIQTTWSKQMTVTGMYMDTKNNDRTMGYAKIQHWNGNAWITDATVSGQLNDWWYAFAAPVNTDRVRLFDVYATNNAGQMANPLCYEWEIYGY